jgi:predicted PurR-regulated permease PerM
MPPPPAYDGGSGYSGQGGGTLTAPRNGFGIAALVLGILALVLCWTAIGGIVLGVLAVIFAILGIRRANRQEATNKGMAISGLVTGVIGLIIAVVLIVILGSFWSVLKGSVSDYTHCLQQAGQNQAAQQQCRDQYNQQVQQKINGN